MYILSARECMIVNNLYNTVINIPVRVRLSYNTRYLRKAGYYLGWGRHGGRCSLPLLPTNSSDSNSTCYANVNCFLNSKISALLTHISKILSSVNASVFVFYISYIPTLWSYIVNDSFSPKFESQIEPCKVDVLGNVVLFFFLSRKKSSPDIITY